jgi:transposase-like protein
MPPGPLGSSTNSPEIDNATLSHTRNAPRTITLEPIVIKIYPAEQSHESTRVRERGMRRFKSMGQAQRFATAHPAVYNLFNFGRHLVSANQYRNLRISAFNEWSLVVA